MLRLSFDPFRLPRQRLLYGAALLVLALLWAQMLGLAHGVRHAGLSRQLTVSTLSAPPVATVGLLAHLLASTGDDGDCRLYDQLGHGGPLVQLPVLAAAVLPVLVAWPVALAAPTPACAAFVARGPPSSR